MQRIILKQKKKESLIRASLAFGLWGRLSPALKPWMVACCHHVEASHRGSRGWFLWSLSGCCQQCAVMLSQSSVRLQEAGSLRASPPQSSLQTAGVSDVGRCGKIRTKLTNLTWTLILNGLLRLLGQLLLTDLTKFGVTKICIVVIWHSIMLT